MHYCDEVESQECWEVAGGAKDTVGSECHWGGGKKEGEKCTAYKVSSEGTKKNLSWGAGWMIWAQGTYLDTENKAQNCCAENNGSLEEANDIEGDDHVVFSCLVASNCGSKFVGLHSLIAKVFHLWDDYSSKFRCWQLSFDVWGKQVMRVEGFHEFVVEKETLWNWGEDLII